LSNLKFIEDILGFGVKNPFLYFQFGVDEETKIELDKLITLRNQRF